jgi:hypothetical protein
LRAGVARVVEAGEAVCARCGRPIRAGEDWDLDHGPDKSSYLGERCGGYERPSPPAAAFVVAGAP